METESKREYVTELPLEIQKMLKNMDFPIERKEVIEQARELGMLPDKKYNSAEDLAEELHIVYIGVPA